MKYELLGKNDTMSPIEQVLHNRGIDDVEKFLGAGENPGVLNHYSRLDNIDEAVSCLLQHIGGGNNIWVQVDPDV